MLTLAIVFVLFPENKLWSELKISEEESMDVEILELPMLLRTQSSFWCRIRKSFVELLWIC